MTTPRVPSASTRRSTRLSAVVGVVVFLLLAGTGAASAAWTTGPSQLSASVTAGTVESALTGVDGLSKVYTPTDLVDFAAVIVNNSGNVPTAFTFGIKASSGTNIANAIQTVGWTVASTGQCTATVPSSGTTGASLTSGITLPAVSLNAGQSAIFCIRTSLTSDQVKGLPSGDSISAIGTATGAVGSWSSVVTDSARQSVAADTVAPSRPTNLRTTAVTANQISMRWDASTDSYGVTGYRIYRAGILIATVDGQTFTDTGLNGGTPYIYTVRAFDKAGNESADSNTVNVTTSASYNRIRSQSGMCIEAENSGTANGTRLILATCSDRGNQRWQFAPVTGDFVKVVPSYSTSLAWDIDGVNGNDQLDYTKAKLWTYVDVPNQQWTVQQENGGTVRFVNRSSGKCLDIPNNVPDAGTQLQQFTCNGTTAQSWSLTAVG